MHFTNPKFQALDGNGNPLSGGKLYTYTGGTSTAKTTYSTRDCSTTANANPIVLNSRGEAVIYGKGNFKFVLKDADGVTIWTFDDILMSGESLWDSDRDTSVQVEEDITGADEDKIRFDTAGTQRGVIDATGWQETISGTDYKLANFRELWGSFQRSKFVWGDATSLLIEPGAYWCKEKFCSWALQLDLTVSTLTSGKWYDVYLDYSTITSGTVLTNANFRYVLEDTEVATWNDTYRGWYSDTTADDKCIFGFYADGANTMDEFFHDGNLVIYADNINARAEADLAKQTWTNVTLEVPDFVRAVSVHFYCEYDSETAAWHWRTDGQTATTGHLLGHTEAGTTRSDNTINVICSSGLIIEVYNNAASSNTEEIGADVNGWLFPIGM